MLRSTLSRAALCLSLSLLASCATHSSPTPSVKPQRPSPETCLSPRPEPRLPETAGIVRPSTLSEAQATSDFLNWVADTLDWGRTLAKAQAKVAQSPACKS